MGSGTGDGAATAVTDFAEVDDFTITIQAGTASATGTFTLDPVQDAIDEGAGETAGITGSTAAGDTVTGTEVTIADDDAAPAGIALTVDPGSVAESANPNAPNVTVTATVTGGTTYAADKAVTVSVGSGTGDGAATAVTDFAAVTDFTITIQAGTASAAGTFTLDPVGDAIDEGTGETVSVAGTTTASDAVTGTTVTITDDDDAPAGITLAASPGSVGEAANPATPNVTVTATVTGGTTYAADKAVTVSVDSGTGDGAATAVTDFAAVTDFTITIPAGALSASGTFTLDPVEDAIDEGTGETVSVAGKTADGDTVTGTTVTITDNDDAPAGITLTVDPGSVAESANPNAANVTVTATVTGGTVYAAEKVVTVVVDDGTAVEGTDFAAVTDFTITIPAGTASATGTFTLDPVQDAIDEGAGETAAITGATPDDDAVTATEVTITDDDDAPEKIVLTADPTAVTESANATTVTVTASVTGGTTYAADKEVTVIVGSGTATEGTDFEAVAGFTITIPAGTASAAGTFALDPIEDTIDEDAGETVAISGSIPGSNTVEATTVTITDNDGAPTGITLTASPVTVAESANPTAANVTVTATVNGGTAWASNKAVTVVVGSGTATEGTDFANVADFEITIPAGSSNAAGQFTLDPIEDTIDEGAGETVSVSGSTPDGYTVTATKVTITDNDTAGLTGAAAVTVNENEAAVGAYGVTGAPPAETVVWALAGADAAAFEIDTGGALAFRTAPDFEAPADAGNDNIYEVTVEAATGGGRSLASLAVAVTVADMAEPPPAPEAPTVTGASNVSLAVTWTAPAVPAGTPPITGYRLQYREEGASGSWISHDHPDTSTAAAIAGLAPGTSYEVQVMAFNHEGDSGWSPSGAGATGRAVSIAIADGRAREGREVVFTVTLSSAAGIDVVLNWTTADGTAKASDDTAIPDDYTEADGTLTIPDGSISGTITVKTVDDRMAEDDETFKVVLSAPAAGLPDGVVLTDAEAVGTIEDDDEAPARIVLSATDTQGDVMTEIPEGGGETEVTVKATVEGGSTFPEERFVRVLVEGSGGSGVVGFAASPNTFDIEIPAGHVSASRKFDLAPEDDDVDEADETVQISGEMVPEAARRSRRAAAPLVIPVIPARLTIVDDDAFTVIGPRRVEVDEGETRVASYRVAGAPEGAAVTWSLTGTDAEAFEIGDNGALAFRTAPDFGAPTDAGKDNGYEVTVQASVGDASAALEVTVTVRDVNEASAFEQGSYAFELDENRDGRETPVALGAVSATDPDAGDTLTYAIAGDAALFEIDAASGALSYIGPGEDYESGPNLYTLTVTATDGSLSTTVEVTVTVVDVNEAPAFEQASYAFELDENRDGREEPVALGAVSATDPDAGDTLTYAIAGDAALFEIDAASGALSYIGPGEDYESEPNLYEFTVTVTDRGGLSATAAVSVEILDVNEAPAFEFESYAFELAENRIGPVALGTLTATDPDAGDTVTYGIAAGDTALFAIDAASGALRYIGPGEDYESDPNVHELTVSATDREGLSGEAAVTVTVTDEADAIARARLRRVNEAILPELLRAIVSGVVESVVDRTEEARSGMAGGGRVAIAGRSVRAADDEVVDALRPWDERDRWRETPDTETMDWKEALRGDGDTPGGGEGGSPGGPGKVTVWGGGDWRALSGGSGGSPVEWDGDVVSARLGVDARLGDDLLAGLALDWSLWSFDWIDRGEPGYREMEGTHGNGMTSLHPYVGWWPDERTSLWASLGYGRGEVEIEDDEAGRQSSDAALGTAAAGARVRLFSDEDVIPGGTASLALRGEAWLSWFAVEDNGDRMAGLTVDTSRLRLGLEGAWDRRLAWGGVLTPSLELGVRHDGGDGETGLGVELGGGLAWTDPALGLTVEGRGRALVMHRGDVGKWGAGGSVLLDPGAGGLGLSFGLHPFWGGAAEGGVDRLWQDEPDSPFAQAAANDNEAPSPAAGLDAELGYGLGVLGGRGVLTPHGGLSLSDGGSRTWRAGGRLAVGPSLTLDLEGERRESADDAPDHGVMLRATARW